MFSPLSPGWPQRLLAVGKPLFETRARAHAVEARIFAQLFKMDRGGTDATATTITDTADGPVAAFDARADSTECLCRIGRGQIFPQSARIGRGLRDRVSRN
jgi:hypothetical protein